MKASLLVPPNQASDLSFFRSLISTTQLDVVIRQIFYSINGLFVSKLGKNLKVIHIATLYIILIDRKSKMR